MCIIFLSTECPFTGLELTMPLSTLFSSSRRSSTEEAMSSALSYSSSRASIDTNFTRAHGSSDSINEMTSTKESSIIATSGDAYWANWVRSWNVVDTTHSDYITAINTLTNILETNFGIEIGRCVDPSSPMPKLCKNFEIRHRSSVKNATGYFEDCVECTEVGKLWQKSRGEVGISWEEWNELSSRGQKIKKAETGMCSAVGCDGCRPKDS